MDPFRCPECDQVKISIPHNDWGRTCFGVERKPEVHEEIPVFKSSPSVPAVFSNMTFET